MVRLRARALLEARAKGLDVASLLHRPFRRLLKVDVLVSSLAISIFLLIYYSAVAFLVIYMTTVFGFTVKDANGLGNWEWGFNIVAVVLIGLLSDRLRVRKPFMVVGGVAAAVMTVVFLLQFGHHPSYYTMAIIVAALSFCTGVAYGPWMASLTETVEARHPARLGTRLAGIAACQVPIHSLASYPEPATIPPALINHAVAAIGGGTTFNETLRGVYYLNQLSVNKAALASVAPWGNALKMIAPYAGDFKIIAPYGAQLQTIAPYATQLTAMAKYSTQLTVMARHAARLTALSKVPPSAFAYLKAHGHAVQTAAAKAAGQGKTWGWVGFGGLVSFRLAT